MAWTGNRALSGGLPAAFAGVGLGWLVRGPCAAGGTLPGGAPGGGRGPAQRSMALTILIVERLFFTSRESLARVLR